MKKLILLILLVGMWPLFSFGQESVVENFVGTSTQKSRGKARRDIQDQAIKETSWKYVREIIGEEKATRNNNIIEKRIIRNSKHYILTMNSGSLQKAKGGGSTMPVRVKLSLVNLKKLLLQEGLLYKLEGSPSVLPVISIMDRVNSKMYRWWFHNQIGDRFFISNQVNRFNDSLKSAMWPMGFYGVNPIASRFGPSLPQSFRTENLRKEDYLFMGEYFKSAIVVRGEIRFGKLRSSLNAYKVDIRLEAMHSGNGRTVGEVIRTYETEAGPFESVVQKKMAEVQEKVSKDLAVQILDAWKRGTFGANLIRLTLKGEMKSKQLANVKNQLLRKVREIKSLRERLFEPNKVTFEVDTSANPEQLAKVLKTKQFSGVTVSVDDVRADGLVISVK